MTKSETKPTRQTTAAQKAILESLSYFEKQKIAEHSNKGISVRQLYRVTNEEPGVSDEMYIRVWDAIYDYIEKREADKQRIAQRAEKLLPLLTA